MKTSDLTSVAKGVFLLATIAGGLFHANSQVILFQDDFNGPTLNASWQASLPNAYLGGPVLGAPLTATYLGVPNYSFQTLDGSSVLRMSSSLNDAQRRGWSTATTFVGNNFRYEVRFNTLTQSRATSIDSFIEIWVEDVANPNRYDIVAPFGGEYSSGRRLFWGSSIDNTFSEQFFPYQDNTWYRLVLEAPEGQNIRASLLSDNGVELFGQSLLHTAGAFDSGYRIVLSQAMGLPIGAYPTDVAVDYVRLTAVPEPTTLALTATGFLLFLLRRRP